MKKLFKYEFRKTWAVKLLVLGLTAAAEIVFLIGVALKDTSVYSTGIILLTLLAFGGVMVIGLQSVLTLHRDMNTRQGYMLFMTPNSSFRILGAKVLENGLSVLLAGAFFFALAAVDISILTLRYNQLEDLLKIFTEFIRGFNQNLELSLNSLASLTFGFLTSWIAMVTTAYLADVVSAALLNGKKLNGLISFALFVALSILMSWLRNLIVSPDLIPGRYSVTTFFLLQGGLELVFAGLMYWRTAVLMERKLSV